MSVAARRRAVRPSPERQKAERRGRLAEFLCRWHLRLRGWHIVASHWRCPAGEIDILARRGRVLAIIEVKSRRGLASGAESVLPRQWRCTARGTSGFLVALPAMLGGCAGVLLVGGLAAAGGGGYAAAQERGVGGAVGDFEIQTDVERAFVDNGPGLQEGIATTVYQGRVMLTGRVATPDMKARAVQVAGRVAGVKALYDEVEVAPPGSTWDATKDSWITARLRSEMTLEPDIRSGNYTIDTS